MIISITLNSQTRQLDAFPESLDQFHLFLQTVFPITLPQRYKIYYYDIHGLKRSIENSDDFFDLILLKGVLQPINVEIEDEAAISSTFPSSNLFEAISTSIFNDQPAPAPLHYTPSDFSSNKPKTTDLMVDEKLGYLYEAQEERKKPSVAKDEPNEDSLSLKLKNEVRNMFQDELPYLATILGNYLAERDRFRYESDPDDDEEDYDDDEEDDDIDEEDQEKDYYYLKYLEYKKRLHEANTKAEIVADIPKYVPSKRPTNNTVHKNIRCSVCGVFPIVGIRYRSTLLDDFDMCESCEDSVDHPYPLIKIKQEEKEEPANREPAKDPKKPATSHIPLSKEDRREEGKKSNKLDMTSLFSNLSLEEVGGLAEKIVKEKPNEATGEMLNLLQKFNKFRIKNSAKSFEEERKDGIDLFADPDDGRDIRESEDDTSIEDKVKDKKTGSNVDTTTLMTRVLHLEELFSNMKFEELYDFVQKNNEKNEEELTNLLLTIRG